MSRSIDNALVARLRVTTPLFCGGADPARDVELRIPSLKGMLRFWWRALPEHARLEPPALARKEAALFGSSDRKIGQSRVLLRVEVPDRLDQVAKGARLDQDGGRLMNGRTKVIGMGARYLGYGLMHAFKSDKKGVEAGELERPCIPAPFEFTLRILLHPSLDAEQKTQIEDALILMGTLGGMGSRARRGYGSLSLVSLSRKGEQIWPVPGEAFEAALARKLEVMRAQGGEELPAWTAVSRRMRVVLVYGKKNESAVSLLDRIGCEMVRYRSWGTSRNGTIDGRGKILGDEPSEQRFPDDHDLMKRQPHQRNTHPRRIAFGLPHNYGREAKDKVGPAGGALDRRASPLFIHIHQPASDVPPVGVLSFLPARFLPLSEDGERPEISVGGKRVSLADDDALYAPIGELLDRFDEGEEQHG